MEQIEQELQTALADLQTVAGLKTGKLLVVGCSTSEVIGAKIGTSGAAEIAAAIFTQLTAFQTKTGVTLAFQCCEHLNRALVIERTIADLHGLEIVSAVPVLKAGGAMATYAYQNMGDPVLVEFISADAGIDIGDTLIGMHLKHVAVPVRSTVKQIGQAHMTMAMTRPKLIGGERAVYQKNIETTQDKSC